MSSDVGTTGLSIMGNRDDLDPFRSAVYSFVVNFVCSTLLVFFGCTAVPGIKCSLQCSDAVGWAAGRASGL